MKPIALSVAAAFATWTLVAFVVAGIAASVFVRVLHTDRP